MWAVPEQLRALALVAAEDLERGRTFNSGCLDLKASRAYCENKLERKKERKKKVYQWIVIVYCQKHEMDSLLENYTFFKNTNDPKQPY